MLHFEGDKDFSQAQAEVWEKLSDARFLAKCIPGVESVARADADQLVCTLRPGFAFVRGTLELTLTIADRMPGSSVRAMLHSKGIGSTSDVDTALTLSTQDGGTRLHWTAEIRSLGGLLKAVPQGLVKASAQRVIDDALNAFETELAQ